MAVAEIRPGYAGEMLCVECEKCSFVDRNRALKNAARRTKKTGIVFRAYLGECGWWHLTTKGVGTTEEE